MPSANNPQDLGKPQRKKRTTIPLSKEQKLEAEQKLAKQKAENPVKYYRFNGTRCYMQRTGCEPTS